MRPSPTVVCAALAALLSSFPAALAEDGPHFALEKTPDGFVRMDTRTGEMTYCREQSGEIACRDDNSAQSLRDEVQSLRKRVDALQRRVDQLEAGAGRPGEGLPDEKEFEKGLSYMDRFFNHFMGMMKNWQSEDEKAQPAPPAPRKDQPAQPM